MHNFVADSVNEAYSVAFYWMRQQIKAGLIKPRPSRGGMIYEPPYPVMNCYAFPRFRVLSDPHRDANPFFHMMEALWMLHGDNDVEWPKRFVTRMGTYSDDGVILRGAYGHRWRRFYPFDQIEHVVKLLGKDPNSRRAVIGMYDPDFDRTGGNDIPCNTQIYFRITDQKHLNMTVCCRSNDIIWGCYGANVVHMSMLHEYVLEHIRRWNKSITLGRYYQLSNSFHAYCEVFDGLKPPEYMTELEPLPLVHEGEPIEDFDGDLHNFFELARMSINASSFQLKFRTTYFNGVVWPMLCAWQTHRDLKLTEVAIEIAHTIQSPDWSRACAGWLMRRLR